MPKSIKLAHENELLALWDEYRELIAQGRVRAWGLCVLEHDNDEPELVLAGEYRDDPELALRAALNASMLLASMSNAEPPMPKPKPKLRLVK